MKKLFIILGLLILTFNVKAQISLEHTFISIGYYSWYFYTDAGIRYYGYNTTTNQMTLYNTDYSIYKTINMVIPSGFKFNSIYCVSEKLFNTDSYIEFIVVINNGADYSMKLYNENQEVIKDFGDRYYAFLILGNGYSKLLTRNINFSSQPYIYIDDIYSLPGNMPNSISTLKPTTLQPAFPNPASITVNLPYALENGQRSIMRIFNSNGQLIEQKQIDSAFNMIILNVESYPSGIYLYEYNGVSNRFIVN